LGLAKSRDGNIEAIRALVAKRWAKSAKIATLNQIRHLGFTAPEEIRQALAGLTPHMVAKQTAALSPRAGSDPVVHATKTALRALGRRVLARDAETAGTDGLLRQLLHQHHEDLLSLYGRDRLRRGTVDHRRRQPRTAALRGVVGPTLQCRPDPRLLRESRAATTQTRRRPASQRRSVDHRHYPHGLRPRTRTNVERRTKEGRSKNEIIRVLKRYVAREVYHYLRPL
jgi:transposase